MTTESKELPEAEQAPVDEPAPLALQDRQRDLPQDQPAPSANDVSISAALVDQWQVKKGLIQWRKFGAAFAFVAGVLIILAVVCSGLSTASDAWAERRVFSKPEQSGRLKYLIVFFTFKAAAMGGALTSGLLLIRAANLLTGGGGAKEQLDRDDKTD